MPLLPKSHLTALACGLVWSACAHTPASALPTLREATAALPRGSASRTPFVPAALEGQVVLVTFVATWCFPCLAELVSLESLERVYAAQGFANVLVGLDLEGARVLEPFAEAYGIRAPLVIADDAVRAGLTPFGRIREVPTRFLFGRDGVLIDAYWGVVDPKALDQVVQRAVAVKPQADRR